MNVSPINAPLFTINEAEQTLGSWLALARKKDEIQRTLEKHERQLDALVQLVAASRLAQIVTTDEITNLKFSLADYAKRKASPECEGIPAAFQVEEDTGFSATIVRLVKQAPGGLTHRQIMDELLKTEHAERVSANEAKRYYTTMGRLFKSGSVGKHGDKVYPQAVLETLKHVPGALAPVERFKKGSSSQQIIDIVNQNPSGLSAGDIKEKLIERSEDNRKRFHGQYVYNALSRLVKLEVIAREDSRYYPIQMETPRGNGASGATASGPAR